MAKLIVVRPRLGRPWNAQPSFDILIDGQPAATIRIGETIEIDIPPGPHQFHARIARLRSQPLVVELAPEETLRIAVGHNVGLHRLFNRFSILASLPFLGLMAWSMWSLSDTNALLSSGVQGRSVMSRIDWTIALMPPTAFLMFVPICPFLFLWWNSPLALSKIPRHDLTDQQIADVLRLHPFRVRITVRQMMIVVALLAIYLGCSVRWTRHRRTDHFRQTASLHAKLEPLIRDEERRQSGMAAGRKRKGLDASPYRRAAARAAARADYHVATKRKYERAAAEGRFSVEPDPPEPPWP
jgi:hypothetical protein